MAHPILARQIDADTLAALRTAIASGASVRRLASAFNLTRHSAHTLQRRYRVAPAPTAVSAPVEVAGSTDTRPDAPDDPIAELERIIGRPLR